jgi:hypothetical protein
MSVSDYVDLQTSSNPSLPKTTGVPKTYSVAFSSKNNKKKQPLVGGIQVRTDQTPGGTYFSKCTDTHFVSFNPIPPLTLLGYPKNGLYNVKYSQACALCWKGLATFDVPFCGNYDYITWTFVANSAELRELGVPFAP